MGGFGLDVSQGTCIAPLHCMVLIKRHQCSILPDHHSHALQDHGGRQLRAQAIVHISESYMYSNYY